MLVKKSCKNCSSLKGCIKIIKRNVNNRLSPLEKDWINCVNFENLESIVEECVMYGLEDVLEE